MQAMLWEPGQDGTVHCELCSHGCRIARGKQGVCGIRVNHNGKLISLVGDVVTAVNMDPVEKKPLYHFLPGTKTFSIGSAGCNFRCIFCQNNDISQVSPQSTIPGRRMTPESIVRLAEQNNALSIAFTYNEPTTFFELSYAAAGLAKARGLKTILVSNGYMSAPFLQSMSKRIDAANIDLKGFNEEFYRKFCGGRLQPVLDNLKRIRDLGWWLEVTTLIIPGVNDSKEETQKIAEFIYTELGPDTPWHISAFHGAAQMINHPSTPLDKLEEVRGIGKGAGLNHVYIGNVHSSTGSQTSCPECGLPLIERSGYRIRRRMHDGVCPGCKTSIAGVWN